MKQNSGSDFIKNLEFVEWILNRDDERLSAFIVENPHRRKEIDQVVFMIRKLQKEKKELNQEMVVRLWERIEKGISAREKTRRIRLLFAAASVFLLFGIGSILFYRSQLAGSQAIDYSSVAKIEPEGDDVKLILSDKSEILADNNSEIKYNKEGKIAINETEAISGKKTAKGTAKEQLNQLVVPLGKHSSLILSDGTKLWLNSGSRAIYPVVFTGKKREIYVEGEAFLEVTHHPEKPFYVITSQLEIRVLGTKFNVSAYPDDATTSVVLVEGSVQAKSSSKKVLMKKNQLFAHENASGITSLKEVDVLEYISWKDGWMHCNKERLENIAVKLSRYYNVMIRFKNPDVKDITLTGKLDLKSNCEEIFKAIMATAPIEYETDEKGFILSERN